MRSSFLIFSCLCIVLSCSKKQSNYIPVTYPSTTKADTIDHYFGKAIADPYRWLENDTSSQTAEWVKQENEVTFNYLAQIPFRETIRKRLTELYHYTKMNVPERYGHRLFYLKKNSQQNQAVLYVQEGENKDSARVLVDPNQLDEKEGIIAIKFFTINDAGTHLAYSFSKGGSDWETVRVIDLKTGTTLPDEIKWIKFTGEAGGGIGWKGNGFYYGRFETPKKGEELSGSNQTQRVYYHKLGESQDKDKLIYEEKGSKRMFTPMVIGNERFLVIYVSETTSGDELLIKDLKNNSPFVYCDQSFKDNVSVIGFLKGQLIALTSKKAPRFRIVAIDPTHPEEKNWKTLVPENKNLLYKASVSKNKILATYLQDASSQLVVLNPENGKIEKELALPDLGTVEYLSSDSENDKAYFTFETFSSPITIYEYSAKTDSIQVFYKPASLFNSQDYETKQVFYTSKDGTKIPLFLTYRKGLKMNKTTPVFLYGYGGFNVSVTPKFRSSQMVWMENGGIYAVANIRGGGEYGETWHEAGTKCKKQNVFDDFISAAEYLIQNNYTSSEKLVINGGSNGGLLVAAVMTQRPDLAKVVIPNVGVLDMLRYHKFTIGYTWSGDYGTSDDKEQFECLLKYSPLHTLKETNYPATLILTGDHDDRVVPAHSFKFAATLQEKQKGKNPVLIRIETSGGHGAGKPVSKQIDEFTDMFTFIFYNLGLTPVQEKQ